MNISVEPRDSFDAGWPAEIMHDKPRRAARSRRDEIFNRFRSRGPERMKRLAIRRGRRLGRALPPARTAVRMTTPRR